MPLARSGTQRAPNGAPRTKKEYKDVEQAMKQLYPTDKQHNVVPDIDIVLVPGLGANPEESWVSESTKFNWTTEALRNDFPKARLLLYKYQSAWTGSLQVQQFMENIANGLLTSLQSVRKTCKRRPIVMIGHSMGGLVVAKAITIADKRRRDKFPIMFEAIAAAIFFGTPFNGAPVASVAAMYAYAAQQMGTATSSKLLDLMKPGDESLRELKHEFMRLVGKLTPKIELFCFYEEQPTDWSKMAGLPSLFGLTKLAIPKSYAEFVNRDSATLPGVDELGLACTHRDLVKFDGHKDPRWSQFVREPLKRIILGAQLAVKNRMNSVRDIDGTMIKKIMDALEGGVTMAARRNTLRQTFSPSSWITKEGEYIDWLAEKQNMGESDDIRLGDCLWVRGPEGRGKTSAALAAVEEIEVLIRSNEENSSGEDPILLAYFFCDPAPDFNTAEDVLKSFVRQLINQQETLAPYAKMFAKKKGNEAGKSQAQVTIENLWMALQDMLADEFCGSKVIFVLNNLHVLPEDSDSTIKLMKYLNGELQYSNRQDIKRVPVRWLITSREAYNVETALEVDTVRLVDLKDDKYGDQVQMALRKHAKERVAALEQEKKYNKALAYFASSLIGRRAQNTQWIDITCVQLEELPLTESDLPVRRALETMPQDLKTLLNKSWMQVFRSNEQHAEAIREMLRALVLTYEDPSEEELGVLAGLCSNEHEKEELHGLIDCCKPLLSINEDGTISFINVFVKTHLLENAKELLGLSEEEIKWQHGVLALRAFSHLMEKFDFEPTPEGGEEAAAGEGGNAENSANANEGSTAGDGEQDNASTTDDNESEDQDDDDEDDGSEGDEEEEEDEDDYDGESEDGEEYEYKALPYAIKHWLRHASKATLEIAEDLSLEEDFWSPDSRIRRNWLEDYNHAMPTFNDFDHTTLNGLHIAASIGFRQLVAALIRNGHEEEINTRDSLINTPLHFAANFGRPKIVEELLNHGAAIDDGIEISEQTPLHMAAFGGHIEVMKKLVLRGANPNATSKDIGPVVNAAISSGNRAAVELLVESTNGVSLTVEREEIEAPLALAALLSDVSMFEYLIEKYADKLPPVEYSKALVKAAEAGRIEVFSKLLEFQHSQQHCQDALNEAVEEWNWDIVTAILERYPGLDCNTLFYTAATCSEPQDKMVELAWGYANGSITSETLNKSLYDATDREKESTVRLLLEIFHADPNATGKEYGNALTAAAYDGTIDIVKMLLDAGANVNSPDGYALQAAAAQGHYVVVEELLRRHADVDALTTREDFTAGTALQAACEASRVDIVRLLLEHGADPNHGAGEDAPPVVAAALHAEEEILELLVQRKPKLDVFGGWDHSSPLINAAAFLPVSSLKLLLDAGADINLQDNDGDTALIVASSRGDDDKEAVEFLLNNGADIMHSSSRNENALQAAMKQENHECLEVLVEHVSVLFTALKKSMDAGNPDVTSVVRSATTKKQGLDYGDDGPRANNRHGNDNEAKLGTNGAGSRSLDQNGIINDVNDVNGSSNDENSQGAIEKDQSDSNGFSEAMSSVFSMFSRKKSDQPAEEEQSPQETFPSYHEATLSVLEQQDSGERTPEVPRGVEDMDNGSELDRDFRSQSPTEVPTDDDTDVASSTHDDDDDDEGSRTGRSLHDEPYHEESYPVDHLSQALDNGIKRLSCFGQTNEDDRRRHSYTEEDRSVDHDYSPESEPEPKGKQPAELSHEDRTGQHSQTPPVELPNRGIPKRKPAHLAPLAPFHEAGSSHNEDPTSETAEIRYQAQPTPPNGGYDQATPTQPSHPRLDGQSFQTQQGSQAPTSYPSSETQRVSPPSSYHAYQPSTSSQATGSSSTDFQQQQQAQSQAQPQGQYQNASLYDGSHYGNTDMHFSNAAQQQSYMAYHPNDYRYMQQQQQQQQQYTPEQLQAYQNQQYHDPYQNYYASLNVAQQQKMQQEQQRRQDMPQQQQGGQSWEAPQLKTRTSSSFTNNVKNTFDKAKISGFLSRR
ncbi:hypothetical protein F5Y18DRAFT_359147 [Xylariaceae sp. FL1019]|nr:hypothetical protein F5Y18DRAFT_359147 [Xylariaceae sp. FL1019]